MNAFPTPPTLGRCLLAFASCLGPACLGGQMGVVDSAGSAAEIPAASMPSSQSAGQSSAASEANQAGTAGEGNTQMAPDANALSPAPVPFNCDEQKYLVCDGFESVAAGEPPNPLRWNSQVALPSPDDGAVHNDHPGENTILVTDKMAHTGSKSLHLHSSPGWAHLPIEAVVSAAYPKPLFPAPKDTFFVRMWVYNDGLAGDHSADFASGHWYLVNASGPLAGRQQYQKFGGGGGTLGWNYYGNDAGLGSNFEFAFGAWTCLEVQFKGDSNELFVWQNDLPVDALHSTAWAAPSYNRLTVGWEMDHPSGSYPGMDVYIDDIAYSYARIGCKVTAP